MVSRHVTFQGQFLTYVLLENELGVGCFIVDLPNHNYLISFLC